MRFRRSSEAGQSLAETALIMPVFLLLLIALFDGGRAIFTLSTLNDTARQGARVAVVNQLTNATECDVRRPVEDKNNPHWGAIPCAVAAGATVGLQAADVQVTYAAPAGTTLVCQMTPTVAVHVGCLATVSVAVNWQPVTPLVGDYFGPIRLTSTAQMPVERVFP